jgi:hypothetical protein
LRSWFGRQLSDPSQLSPSLFGHRRGVETKHAVTSTGTRLAIKDSGGLRSVPKSRRIRETLENRMTVTIAETIGPADAGGSWELRPTPVAGGVDQLASCEPHLTVYCGA